MKKYYILYDYPGQRHVNVLHKDNMLVEVTKKELTPILKEMDRLVKDNIVHSFWVVGTV